MSTTLLIGIICAVGIVAVALIAWLLRKNMKKLETAVVFDQPEEQSIDETEKKDDFIAEQLKDFDCEDGRYYDQLFIPTAEGEIAEAKQVLVTSKGLFIFQHIDAHGWILGREDSRWWTHFVSTDEKHFINNPIWQVDDTIERLIRFFPKTEDVHYHTYVVFSNQCELRSIELWGNTRVVNERDFLRSLQKDLQMLPQIFPDEVFYQMIRVMDNMTEAEDLTERLEGLKSKMVEEKDSAITALDEQREAAKKRRLKHMRPEDCFTRPELALRDALIMWRRQQALQLKITEFEIFDNRTLDRIVLTRPITFEALAQIPGMDADRIRLFGEAIIVMIEHAPEI